MSGEMQSALTNFKRCAEEAPEGTYEEAKRLNAVIGSAVDQLMRDLRAMGLKGDACDRAFELEAALYAYAKQSNPDATVFPMSEGFGSSMGRPERERVLLQAQSNRDFLHVIGVNSN